MRVQTQGPAFDFSFTIDNPIQVSEAGIYALSFYSFLNCNGKDCTKVGDTLSVKIKSEQKDNYIEIFKMSIDQEKLIDNKWKKDELFIHLEDGKVYVCKSNFF